jgi:hypothetical protein
LEVSKLSKSVKNKKSQLGIEKANPPYLPNGEGLRKFSYIIGIRTLENGGGKVCHLQIRKK